MIINPKKDPPRSTVVSYLSQLDRLNDKVIVRSPWRCKFGLHCWHDDEKMGYNRYKRKGHWVVSLPVVKQYCCVCPKKRIIERMAGNVALTSKGNRTLLTSPYGMSRRGLKMVDYVVELEYTENLMEEGLGET